MRGLDAPALRSNLLDMYDAYVNLRCPHRPPVDKDASRAQYGPREPIPAAVLDAESTVKRGLLTLYKDTRAEYSFECPPISSDPKRYFRHAHTPRPTVAALVTWLHDHAEYVVKATTDPQLWYVVQLVKATRQLAGMTPSGDTYNALARSVVNAAATGSNAWLSSYRAAGLLTAMGIPTTRRAVARWGRQGHVEVSTGESGALRYKAGDVIRRAEQLARSADTPNDDNGDDEAAGGPAERTSDSVTIDIAQTSESDDS